MKSETTEAHQPIFVQAWSREIMPFYPLTLNALHAKAVELSGVAQVLDLIMMQVGECEGRDDAYEILSKMILERCAELHETHGEMRMKQSRETDKEAAL